MEVLATNMEENDFFADVCCEYDDSDDIAMALHGRRGKQSALDRMAEALYSAVATNDVASLRKMLDDGANPDTCFGDEFNKKSKSILHVACGKGYTDCVRALLEAGAMPDIHDKWGQMPLHYCICSQFLDTARALLDFVGSEARGIVNNKLGMKNKTCLNAATERGCVEAVELLISYGADVNDFDYLGSTPLMVAARSKGRGDSMGLMNIFVEAGADLDLKDYKEQTALQMAVMTKNVDAVEYLISVGASVNTFDSGGRSPLTNTIHNHIRFIQGECLLDPDAMTMIAMLTQAGTDLNQPSLEANALAAAASVPCAPLLHFFLEQGADPNVFVSYETTPLLLAVRKRDAESVKALLYHNCCLVTKGGVSRPGQSPCSVDPMDVALSKGSLDLVYLLLVAGDEAWRSGLQFVDSVMECDQSTISSHPLHDLLIPPSLCALTVYRTRHLLGLRLHKSVPLLPLPSKIKDLILLTGVLS